jgi:uncharacterized membrane protein
MVSVLCTVAAFSLSVAVALGAAGAWWVMPFSGLEWLAVAAAFSVLYRHRGDREAVVLTATRVRVVCVRAGRASCAEFARGWTRVNLERDGGGYYPSRLLIGSHGHFVEVGVGLRERWRERVARTLTAALRSTG